MRDTHLWDLGRQVVGLSRSPEFLRDVEKNPDEVYVFEQVNYRGETVQVRLTLGQIQELAEKLAPVDPLERQQLEQERLKARREAFKENPEEFLGQEHKGFAVGRTIFSHVAEAWLENNISDEQAVQSMAKRFDTLSEGWIKFQSASSRGLY